MANYCSGILAGVCLMILWCIVLTVKPQTNLIQRISDPKEFKKYLRTHINVLVVFAKSDKDLPPNGLNTFNEVASQMKGVASVVYVDCSSNSKPCKKLKSSPSTFEVKHYKDGDYHKVYDRQLTVKSMVNFLSNPTGDAPWEEDASASSIIHIGSKEKIAVLLPEDFKFKGTWSGRRQREEASVGHVLCPVGDHGLLLSDASNNQLPAFVERCGHCTRLKPEFAAAASELKGTAVLVGMDVDKPENYDIRTEYNITGFPTLCYFENSKYVMRFGGESNKDGIITWIRNPSQPVEPQKEPEWSDVENEVVHLTEATFDEHIASVPSVLVMFYAPWCGHCKKMKPEYEQAAERLKADQIDGSLAAVDATKEPAIGKKFDIKGYPTVKYFKGQMVLPCQVIVTNGLTGWKSFLTLNQGYQKVNGKYAFEVNERTADKIVEFMKDPKEPPPPPPEDASWENSASNVVHLDADTFKPLSKKKKHVLVMFYAPWCGHCKKAKPEFSSAADHFSDTKVSFAAVDCTKHATLCQTYDVAGYPTFIYFNYGKNDIKYTGGREKADFIRFMNDPLSPLSLAPSKPSPLEQWLEVDNAKNIHHLTEETFDSVLSKQKSVLVLFYAPWCGHCKAMKPAYAEAAAILKAKKVACILAAVDATTERSLQDKYHIESFPTIKYFSDGVEEATYKLRRQTDDFVAFMETQVQLALAETHEVRSDQSQFSNLKEFEEFVNRNANSLILYHSSDCKNCEEFRASFQEVVAQLEKMSVTFPHASINCSELSSKDFCRETTVPTLRFYKGGEHSLDYTGSASVDSILQFIKSWLAEKDEL